MSKYDPRDAAGEYCRESSKYCAEEGHVPIKDRPFLREKPKTVTQHVHELLVQRERIGLAKYHRPLTAHDGRDTLQDAIEEAADLLQYLVKMKLEREG